MEVNIIKLKGALVNGHKDVARTRRVLLLFSFLFCLFVGRDSQVGCMVSFHVFYLKVALNFGGIYQMHNHTCI